MITELRPRRIVLVEAEVWPNIVAQATDEGIPVTLVNARLSPRSEASYRKYRRLISPVFQMLDRVCVQEPEDVERWIALGVDRDRITFTGSIKYDPQGSDPDADQVRRFEALLQDVGLAGRPLLLAASTHPGEESELARVFQSLAARHPSLGLLIVPRPHERGAGVQAELQALGLPLSLLRSRDPSGATDVLVIDSTGEPQSLAAARHHRRHWQEFTWPRAVRTPAEGGNGRQTRGVRAAHGKIFAPLTCLLLGCGGVYRFQVSRNSPALESLLADPAKRDALAQAARRLDAPPRGDPAHGGLAPGGPGSALIP